MCSSNKGFQGKSPATSTPLKLVVMFCSPYPLLLTLARYQQGEKKTADYENDRQKWFENNKNEFTTGKDLSFFADPQERKVERHYGLVASGAV